MTDEKYNRLLQAAVPSKDVREYCEKLGRVFEPYELATLITQNSLLSYSQQDALLAELIPELKTEPNAESKNIGGRYKNSYSSAEVADEIEVYIELDKKKEEYLLNDFSGNVYELECNESADYRRGGDISDVGIPADYLKDETFTYEHLDFFPTLCEKVDVASCKDSNPAIPLLEACATVMSGNGSFEYLFHEWNKYIDQRKMEYHRRYD